MVQSFRWNARNQRTLTTTLLNPSIKGDGSNRPCVDKVLSQCLPVSRRMIILLCHSPHLRELLGGFDETCQWISRSGCQVDLRPTLRVSDVSVENPNPIHDQEKPGNERDLHTSSHPRSIPKSLTSPGSPSRSSGEVAQDTPQVGSSNKSRRWSTRTKCICSSSSSA